MKIYLVRHGQSKANDLNIFLGHGDIDLTEKGYAQAKSTAKYLSQFKIDKIYSSDLLRAYHTAEQTAKFFGLEVITDKALREIECGEWDYRTYDELTVEYPQTFGMFINDMAHSYCDGGESVAEVQTRVVNAIEKIAKANPNKTVAIFSHATSIKSFVGYCVGKDLETINKVAWPSNASVTEIDYIDGEFKMIDYSKSDFMGDLSTFLPEKL